MKKLIIALSIVAVWCNTHGQDSVIIARILIAPQDVVYDSTSPMPWCSGSSVTGRGSIEISRHNGYKYTIWDTKPVPQIGYYHAIAYSPDYDRCYYYEDAIFYNARLTQITTWTRCYKEVKRGAFIEHEPIDRDVRCRIDTGYIRSLITINQNK